MRIKLKTLGDATGRRYMWIALVSRANAIGILRPKKLKTEFCVTIKAIYPTIYAEIRTLPVTLPILPEGTL